MHGRFVGAAALVLLSPWAFAEDGTVTTALQKIEAPKIFGSLDLRPSVQAEDGLLYSEDAMELGVQFRPGRSLSYVQTFFTHEPGTNDSFIKPTVSPGYLRAKVGNIARIAALGVDVSYESRTYLPTWHVDRERGMIVTFRNYLKLNKDFGSKFSLMLMELPIFHFFDRAGTGTRASPVFENRVYLVGTWNITDKLSFSLPIMFHQTLHREYAADLKFGGGWSYFLWVNPEINYALTPKVTVGAGYYTADLVRPDLSATALEDGLGHGVFQLVANIQI